MLGKDGAGKQRNNLENVLLPFVSLLCLVDMQTGSQTISKWRNGHLFVTEMQNLLCMNCNSQDFEHESSVYWHGQSENMLSVYIRSLKVGSGWIYRV